MNCVYSDARDIEDDRIGSRMGVRIEDRLTQGAFATVLRVCHFEYGGVQHGHGRHGQ